MAERPVFVPQTGGKSLVWTHYVEFPWSKGLNIVQAQKSILALHAAACSKLGVNEVLEISSKSQQPVGVKLSAFNLMIKTLKHEQEFSVECAYQASKVFERGGPFKDLFYVTSREAKRDERLTSSGRLISYRFFGVEWKLEPRTAFYDWLYISALHKHPELAKEVLKYKAFTDIAFNPARSINCQAYSAALYVALVDRNLLTKDLLKDQVHYLEVIKGMDVSNAHENTHSQAQMAF